MFESICGCCVVLEFGAFRRLSLRSETSHMSMLTSKPAIVSKLKDSTPNTPESLRNILRSKETTSVLETLVRRGECIQGMLPKSSASSSFLVALWSSYSSDLCSMVTNICMSRDLETGGTGIRRGQQQSWRHSQKEIAKVGMALESI